MVGFTNSLFFSAVMPRLGRAGVKGVDPVAKPRDDGGKKAQHGNGALA
jgi:hypothetical protein